MTATTCRRARALAAVVRSELREAGFTEAMYSEDMFRKWIARYQQAKLIPARK